jgi:hypothetical protein
MSTKMDRIRELVGWELDASGYRPEGGDHHQQMHARTIIARRQPFQMSSALVEYGAEEFGEGLAAHAARPDLQAEMEGLEWSLGIVDLRRLLAFQRRLCFKFGSSKIVEPAPQKPLDLTTLAFGPAQPVAFDLIRNDANRNLILQSRNPNLHFRFSSNVPSPVSLHTGSPFFEVAEYRNRWFLRDGYHRAYALLHAGIFTIPAVIVNARTLEELGADQPWFFSEEILFSASPPYVTDFLDDELIIEYERPPLIKTLRIAIEETFAFDTTSGEQL